MSKFNTLAALALVCGASSCTSEVPSDDANTVAPAMVEPEPTTSATLAESAMDRQALLVTLLSAASAAIVGADDVAQQKALNGRRFDLKMRFGCPETPPAAMRSWSYDEKAAALRVSVKPDIDEADEDTEVVGNATGGGAVRRAGFEIFGPNVLIAGCPTRDYAAVPGFSNLRFLLVETAKPDAPRAQQLLNAYDVVKKIAPAAVPTEGLDLVLRGRLNADADGRVVNCTPRGGTAECSANVSFEKVLIENPGSKTLIAEWGAN